MVSGGIIPMRVGVFALRAILTADTAANVMSAAIGTPAVIHAPTAYQCGRGVPVHAHAKEVYAVRIAVMLYGTARNSHAALDNSCFL